MLIPHKGHTDTIQVYSVTVMTHVKALQAGHSSQGTSEPITPAITDICTGGQQCKYQLLGSGVNTSYYLHRGDFFVIVLKKYEGMQISLSNVAHTYILAL